MLSHRGFEPRAPGLKVRFEVIFAVSSRPNAYRIVPLAGAYQVVPDVQPFPIAPRAKQFAHRNKPLDALWCLASDYGG